MNILITGATGFIGRCLIEQLTPKYRLTLISRSTRKCSKLQQIFPDSVCMTWKQLESNPGIISNIDTIIHLCGQSLLGIWTNRFKQRLYTSRIQPLKQLNQYCQSLSHYPHIICASGVGAYGYQSSETPTPLTERDTVANATLLSDLANTCESTLSESLQSNACYLRFGVVLDKSGGSLPLMLLPHFFNMGMVIGSGKQPFSFVSLTDAVRAIIFSVDNHLIGPFNIVTPKKYTNQSFNQEIAKAMHRYCFLRLPHFIAKYLGEMFFNTILTGQSVSSEKIASLGFKFKQPSITDIMKRNN